MDTGPLLATLDREDIRHWECAALRRGREQLVVPAPVLVEVDYWCGRKGLAASFDEVLREARRGVIRVEDIVADDYERILELRSEYRDLRVGYVDAAVLAIVERLEERKLATLDHRHFGVMRPRHVAALDLPPAPR